MSIDIFLFPLIAALGTLIIEVSIFYFFNFRRQSQLVDVGLVNVFTNLLLSVCISVFSLTFRQVLYCEVLIVCTEYVLLRWAFHDSTWLLLRSVTISNITSWASGLVIFSFLIPGYATLIRCHISTDQLRCIQQHLSANAHSHPERLPAMLSTTYTYWHAFFPTLDRRGMSDTVHEIGMHLGSHITNLNEALRYCSSEWIGGCLHGVVMAHVLEQQLTIPQVLTLCDKLDSAQQSLECWHGAGHALWMSQKFSHLQQAIDACKRPDVLVYQSCASGVLMEYSKGTDRPHDHSHSVPMGITNSQPLPCHTLSTEDQQLCYASQASYLLYYPDSSLSDALKYCEETAQKNVESCRAAAYRRWQIRGL